MRFTSLLLVAFVAVGGLVGACQRGGEPDVDRGAEGTVRLGTVEAVDTLSRAVALNDRPLVIEGFHGSVSLEGREGETAELRFVRRGRGADSEAARRVLDDISITESGSQDAYTFTLESEGQAYAVVDVSGTVPRSSALRIEQTSGPVSVTSVRGPVTVRLDHGSVTVRGAAGPVDVETQNGNVTAGFQSVPSDASITLTTENGDVDVRLPPEASARIEAETDVGAIRTSGLNLTDEEFTPRNAGGRYSGQMGEGGALVDVETQNGTITIRAADTTAVFPPQTDTLSVPPSDTVVTPTPGVDTPTSDTMPAGPDTTRQDSSVLDTTRQ